MLSVTALDFGEGDSFDPAGCLVGGDGWRTYVRGIVNELRKVGIAVPAGELAIAGNLARGTGLSSSASLEVALATVLLAAVGEVWEPTKTALLAQRAECDFVGMRCGNLDQIASSATTAGHALLIDCRSLALQQIIVPADCAVIIVQSGVVRGLVDGEYNLRRRQCERAAKALGVAALRDADEAMLEAAADQLDDVAYVRARHVIGDNRRTLAAAEALAVGDLFEIGRLMRESHVSQSEDFGITVPETDHLATILNEAIGLLGGARQTGGGFGGAVIGLVPAAMVTSVRETVLAEYRTPFGERPSIIVERPASGATLEASW